MDHKPAVAVVNDQDHVIGAVARDQMETNAIYRVSALWLTNSNGDILLAQRHRSKTHDPLAWGTAVAGTVEEGETYEENIRKEAREELGIEDLAMQLGPKHLVRSGTYHHFTQWYTATLDRDVTQFRLQEDEVEEVRWVAPEQLRQEVQSHPEEFTPNMCEDVEMFTS